MIPIAFAVNGVSGFGGATATLICGPIPKGSLLRGVYLWNSFVPDPSVINDPFVARVGRMTGTPADETDAAANARSLCRSVDSLVDAIGLPWGQQIFVPINERVVDFSYIVVAFSGSGGGLIDGSAGSFCCSLDVVESDTSAVRAWEQPDRFGRQS